MKPHYYLFMINIFFCSRANPVSHGLPLTGSSLLLLLFSRRVLNAARVCGQSQRAFCLSLMKIYSGRHERLFRRTV